MNTSLLEEGNELRTRAVGRWVRLAEVFSINGVPRSDWPVPAPHLLQVTEDWLHSLEPYSGVKLEDWGFSFIRHFPEEGSARCYYRYCVRPN